MAVFRRLAQTSKQRGDALELRVVRAFLLRGRFPVRKGVIVRDSHGNISEIDVVAGLFFKTYVECKNYSGSVPLEMVAKFQVRALSRFSRRRTTERAARRCSRNRRRVRRPCCS